MIGRPRTSRSDQPYSCSAGRVHSTIRPVGSVTTRACGSASRTARSVMTIDTSWPSLIAAPRHRSRRRSAATVPKANTTALRAARFVGSQVCQHPRCAPASSVRSIPVHSATVGVPGRSDERCSAVSLGEPGKDHTQPTGTCSIQRAGDVSLGGLRGQIDGRARGRPALALQQLVDPGEDVSPIPGSVQQLRRAQDVRVAIDRIRTAREPRAKNHDRTTPSATRSHPGSKRPPPPHRCPQQRVGTGLDSDPRGVAGSCRVDVSSFDDRFDDAVLDRVFCRLVLSALLGHFDSGGLPC